MSITRLAPLAVAAALVVALGGSAVMAGPIGLVDDLSSGSLAAYTLSRVNDGNGTAHVSFVIPASQDLRVSYTGTPNAYEQVLLLRDDYTLEVGETLMADVTGFPPSGGWDRDIGIAVGYSETPPALGAGQSGDVRTSYVEVSFRSNNQVVSYARNGLSGAGGTNLASGQEFAGTNYGGVSFNTTDPLSLFIKRLTDNSYEVGWWQGDTRHVLTYNNNPIMPYVITITPPDYPGAAVGFYADVRAAIAQSPVGLDNLRIIPEPSSVLLTLLGLVGLVGLRRR